MEFPYIKIWCENKLINFYKKIGYEYVESTKDGQGQTVYIMNKPLITGGGGQQQPGGLSAFTQSEFGGFGGATFQGSSFGGLDDQYQLITRF
jgi:hypothetical protein